MGSLQELLKGIASKIGINIEKLLFKFDYAKQTGISVKQGAGSSLTINFVSPQVTNQLIVDREIEKSVVRGKDELGFLTRQDLAGYDALALGAQEAEKKMLKELKQLISHDDFVALSIAITIRRHELAGQGEKAHTLKLMLRERYGERANRIYILYSTGLLDEFMGFMLGWLSYAGTQGDRIQATELWNKCLENMEYGIFVNKRMAESDIVFNLRQRFRVDRLPVVLVFGRTDSIIAKIHRAVGEFLDIESEHQIDQIDYEVRKNEYTVGDHSVLIVTVMVKSALAECKQVELGNATTTDNED
jgi:hypothetical protein